MIIEILLSQLDSDKHRISYRRDWNEITGSVTATILLQQVYYWYQKNNFQPFYKFKEPLKEDSRHYNPDRIGDDWCSELGFTRKEFDGALNRIGFRRTSSNKEEKHGKFIEYWIDARRMTYYKLNMVNFLNALFELSLKYNLYSSKSTKEDVARVQKELYQKYKSDYSKSTFCTLDISDTTQILLSDKSSAHEKNPDLQKRIETALAAEAAQPSKKVAPKKVSAPVADDRSFPADDTELIPLTDVPDWTHVAKEMADFFAGPGLDQWKFQCDAAGGWVDPIIITTMWAGKNQDAPYNLRNWKKSTGKLTNWIKNQINSDTIQSAKIKNLQKPGSTQDRLKVQEYAGPKKEIKVYKVPV